LVLAGCLTLSACVLPGSVKPTVKIGLSAPFEGLHRDLGYEALHAVRLAVQERNAAGGIGGSYWVELVALNDFDEPEQAAAQAEKMAIDPLILGVMGGLSPETALRASSSYERLGLAFLTPQASDQSAGAALPVDPEFRAAYLTLSGNAPPGPVALWAYGTAVRLLDALDSAARAQGQPTREAVRTVLGQSNTQ
jgi:hypothetical protein